MRSYLLKKRLIRNNKRRICFKQHGAMIRIRTAYDTNGIAKFGYDVSPEGRSRHC